MSVQAGTGFYGRVKTVGGTSVVTKFYIFQMLPFFPLESFYCWGQADTTFFAFPFLASVESTTLNGISLARIDKTSVVIAYIRFVTSIVFGISSLLLSMVLLSVFGWIRSPPDVNLGEYLLIAGVVVSLSGFIAALTYLTPQMSHRERHIRSYCREPLGLEIDPARLSRPSVNALLPETSGIPELQSQDSYTQLLWRLAVTRKNIAMGGDRSRLEVDTDDLLQRLRSELPSN